MTITLLIAAIITAGLLVALEPAPALWLIVFALLAGALVSFSREYGPPS